MTEGGFPDILKIARVIPLYKSGENKNINHYRPISIGSFFSKIFEKIMYNYISEFMGTNNLICKKYIEPDLWSSTEINFIYVNDICNVLDLLCKI